MGNSEFELFGIEYYNIRSYPIYWYVFYYCFHIIRTKAICIRLLNTWGQSASLFRNLDLNQRTEPTPVVTNWLVI